MEQNNQKRRSYSNGQNTLGNRDYNQGNSSYRDNDNDNDFSSGNRDYDSGSGQNGDYNNNRRSSGQRNRNGNSNEGSGGGSSYDRNNRFGSGNYNTGNGDYNSGSDYSRSYGEGNYGSDNNRSNYNSDYGDNNRSQDYGRFNQSQDYGRNRGYGNNDNRNDRNWWNRTKDEMSSWFGDDDAQRRRERDQQDTHRGKGPKDYKRSEERIREDINDRLSDAWDVDASEIEVKVDGSEITLSGQVTSKNEKRRAEDIAEQVSGVSSVQNNLRVGKNQGSNQQHNGTTANILGSNGSGNAGNGSTESKTKLAGKV